MLHLTTNKVKEKYKQLFELFYAHFIAINTKLTTGPDAELTDMTCLDYFNTVSFYDALKSR